MRIAGASIFFLVAALAACTSAHVVYCTPDETMCHGSCSALYKDPDNCGACDVACHPGYVCSDGACATSCGAGTTQCGQSCVDVAIDRENCGACETRCASGEACTNGACSSDCGLGQKLCTSSQVAYCASIGSDNRNCGGCGVVCGTAQACVDGACDSSCGEETRCTDVCAALDTDPKHCGSCSNACASDQLCIAGSCECLPGKTLCGATCVDLAWDKHNCGGCSQSCSDTCVSGRCATSLTYTADPAGALVLDAAHAFWTESTGALGQVLKTGKSAKTLDASTSTTSIAVDGTNVYWPSGSEIDFVPIDGGTPGAQLLEVVATEVVADSSFVYVAHASGIVRFPSGGGAVTSLVSGEAVHALALQGSTLYWANAAFEVRRVGIDGTKLTTLAAMSSAISAVVSDGNNVYFTWSSDVLSAPVDASGPPLVLASGLVGVTHIATDGTDLYWVDAASIARVPVAGGARTLLYTTFGDAVGVAVDASAIFWTTSSAVMKLTPK